MSTDPERKAPASSPAPQHVESEDYGGPINPSLQPEPEEKPRRHPRLRDEDSTVR